MTDIWLPFATKVPINKGSGPFTNGNPLGWVLHDNESNGNLDSFFAAGTDRNPDEVCPNFQVYKVGPPHQHLPLLDIPWCQSAGNSTYAAVETEGYATESLNANQIHYLGLIHAAYRAHSIPDAIADNVGQRGIGVHYMGGAAWGGHSCPGTIRAAQRPDIITASQPAQSIPPALPTKDDTMVIHYKTGYYLLTNGKLLALTSISDPAIAGLPLWGGSAGVSDNQWTILTNAFGKAVNVPG